MNIRLPVARGADKTRTTEFTPTENHAEPPLDGIFIDTDWVTELPFDTNSMTVLISESPIEDEEAFTMPLVPYTKTTKNKTRFEIQNEKGRRMKSSRDNPVTQIFLYNYALGESFIKDEKPIYIGILEAD